MSDYNVLVDQKRRCNWVILPLYLADSIPKLSDSVPKSACEYGPLELYLLSSDHEPLFHYSEGNQMAAYWSNGSKY